MGYITKVLILGVCLAFAVYLVGFGTIDTGWSLIVSEGWYSEVGLKLMSQAIVNSFVPSLFAGVGVGFLTGAAALASMAFLATFVATFLFDLVVSPTTILVELGLIPPLNQFVAVLLYLMVLTAIITFIRGSD